MLKAISEILDKARDPWFVVGMVGQVIFLGRFVVQWHATEKAGRVVIPFSFWIMSIVGTVLVFVYSCHRLDPLFILAYSLNAAIYVRNIAIIRRRKARLDAVQAARAAGAGADTSEPQP